MIIENPPSKKKQSKRTPEYQAYASMKIRCLSPKYKYYHRYGGRGIEICERWLTGDGVRIGFHCFLADMGQRPSSKHSLDRIDSDGNYEPGNCRWATPQIQYSNTCRIKWVEIDGERLKFTEACARYGISTHVADNRIRYGWKLEDAIKIPVQKKGYRYANNLPDQKESANSLAIKWLDGKFNEVRASIRQSKNIAQAAYLAACIVVYLKRNCKAGDSASKFVEFMQTAG